MGNMHHGINEVIGLYMHVLAAYHHKNRILT